MKKISLFGNKSINSLVFGILMLLPMFSILGRVIYTQSNPSSKDSYFGENINQSQVSSVDFSDLDVGNTYQYITSSNISYAYQSEVSFNVSNFKRITPVLSDANNARVNRVIIRSQNNSTFVFLYDGSTYVSDCNLNNVVINMTFTYIGGKTGNLLSDYSFFTTTTFNKYSYLDNAFEYSLSTFVEDNNDGVLDLFGWFEDTFLDSANSKNHLYCSFINWYLNYALLVSCAFLIYVFLIWFVSYIRILMDKFLYKDYGGF